VGIGGIVGSGVNVAVGEGGMGVCVAVGIASWVMVMASQACATAVPCTSATERVGVDGPPHADKTSMMIIEIAGINFLFIIFSVLIVTVDVDVQ
jgi:hypothetical protein